MTLTVRLPECRVVSLGWGPWDGGMVDEAVDEHVRTQTHNAAKGIGFGYIIYQHVAGVLGAFALIAFLGHFVHLDWRGALVVLVGVWDTVVRPAVKGIFDATIVAFLKWAFDWHLDVPLIARDYLSVGLLVFLSELRSTFVPGGQGPRSVKIVFRSALYDSYISVLTPLPKCLLFWPFAVMRHLRYVRYSIIPSRRVIIWKGGRRKLFIEHSMALLPLIYCLLLVAANYMLLRPGT